MSNEASVFQRGETVPIHSDCKTWEGKYFTPTSIKVTATNRSGAKVVDNQNMIELATGQYVYYYDAPVAAELGWYTTMVVEVDGAGEGAKTTIKYGGFKIEE